MSLFLVYFTVIFSRRTKNVKMNKVNSVSFFGVVVENQKWN